jgi:homospermidine synthase
MLWIGQGQERNLNTFEMSTSLLYQHQQRYTYGLVLIAMILCKARKLSPAQSQTTLGQSKCLWGGLAWDLVNLGFREMSPKLKCIQ